MESIRKSVMLIASKWNSFGINPRKPHQRAQVSNIPVFPEVDILTVGVCQRINPVKPPLKNGDVKDGPITLGNTATTADTIKKCP